MTARRPVLRYNRLGAALIGLGRAAEAVCAYETAVTSDPTNAELTQKLEDARNMLAEPPAGERHALTRHCCCTCPPPRPRVPCVTVVVLPIRSR